MEWFLGALKVIGLVGAYIGIADRPKETRPSRTRLIVSVLLLLTAIAAEWGDARIRWKDGIIQALRFEQLAHPVNRIAVDVDVIAPYDAISKVAPAYVERLARIRNSDLVKIEGIVPSGPSDAEFPKSDVVGESIVHEAAVAFYDINLSFYAGTKSATAANIDEGVVKSDFAIAIYSHAKQGKLAGIRGVISEIQPLTIPLRAGNGPSLALESRSRTSPR
jgi:hypothetical protein